MTDLFTGTPTTSTPGTAIPITYTNPAEAGHTVDIQVDDDQGNVVTLKVTCDANGKGTTTYTPPAGYVGSLGPRQPGTPDHR